MGGRGRGEARRRVGSPSSITTAHVGHCATVLREAVSKQRVREPISYSTLHKVADSH